MTLTKRQHQTLEFIRDYRRRHGLSPTLEEIAGAFTISKVTVFEHIQALQAKGYIRKTKNRSRSIELVEENLDHDVRDASRGGDFSFNFFAERGAVPCRPRIRPRVGEVS